MCQFSMKSRKHGQKIWKKMKSNGIAGENPARTAHGKPPRPIRRPWLNVWEPKSRLQKTAPPPIGKNFSRARLALSQKELGKNSWDWIRFANQTSLSSLQCLISTPTRQFGGKSFANFSSFGLPFLSKPLQSDLVLRFPYFMEAIVVQYLMPALTLPSMSLWCRRG